mmetsp:Transcript_4141/g.3467  ORF Transcript_4141/g.3467 Transcript_4141/m.3467 type:complete len:86 (+) Transcript_4141:558-815(+)
MNIKKDSSFDKRKHTNKIEKNPLPLEELSKNYEHSETPVVLNYYLLNNKKDIGQRTMVNWANARDRLPTRGTHTRGGRRKEKIVD